MPVYISFTFETDNIGKTVYHIDKFKTNHSRDPWMVL
jgi:hypothetical protein